NIRGFFDKDFPEGYAARGGFTPEVIDNIVKSAAGIDDDEITKDLENIDVKKFVEENIDLEKRFKPELEVFGDETGEDTGADAG
ncbi:MAG TPA: hypothetical protein DEG69_15775, partial [Flavobacteriaceae bacterium]|nr:hypothetical protein [Flavobacteriaceae bacterium]